jgi:hypothetical protein
MMWVERGDALEVGDGAGLDVQPLQREMAEWERDGLGAWHEAMDEWRDDDPTGNGLRRGQ